MVTASVTDQSNADQHLSRTLVPITSLSSSRRPGITFSPYNEETILPLKQKDGYARTYLAVYEALATMIGQAGKRDPKLRQVTAEDVLVARSKEALLDVWDSLQHVNSNRAACLRLTERCATIFTSLYQETVDTKNEILSEVELKTMLDCLTSSCTSIATLFKKHVEAPFIKRYLIRGSIEREISEQHTRVEEILRSLNEVVLHRVYTLLCRSSSEVDELIRGCSAPATLVLSLSPPPIPSHSTVSTIPPITESPSKEEDSLLCLDNVRTHLHTLLSQQNSTDKARDTEDIRVMMNAAIGANNEVTIIQTVLQIPVDNDSMLQAMRSLQNSLKPVQEDDTLTIEASLEPKGNPRSPRYESQSSLEAPDDASVHRQFVRTSVNSLRRISGMDDSSLASWTIAMFELDLGRQVAVDGALRTYIGTWRNKIVAIKEFRPPVSEQDTAGRAGAKSLFTHKVDIWAKLQHPNVLLLFGACSVPSYPPWFAVYPYYVNGNLLRYLTKLPSDSLASPDLLVMISQIARGMEYLHANNVIHGDLKAENILLSDESRCIVSGFGLNEYLSPDNSRPISRWQAPELLRNSRISFTTTTDVYAFAMTCVELLTHGKRPWSDVDGDDEVRRRVLDGKRPALPLVDRPWSSDISQLLISWWNQDPGQRPTFRKIVEDVNRLYLVEIPSPPLDVYTAVPSNLHQERPAVEKTGKNSPSSPKTPHLDLDDGTASAQCFNLREIFNVSSSSRKKPSRAATYPPVHGNSKARPGVRRTSTANDTLLQNTAGESLGPEPEAGTRSKSSSRSTTLGAVIRHVYSTVKRMSQRLHLVKVRHM